MPYLFVIVGMIIAGNVYFLIRRSRKNQGVGKAATAQRIATVKKHDDLVRTLYREQQEAARRVELRNKTLDMYEQVRRNADAADNAIQEEIDKQADTTQQDS